MTYKFIFTKNALQDLGHLDTVIKKRIAKKIKQLSNYTDIYPAAKALTGQLNNCNRIRVGGYRLVVVIENKEVTVLRIQHRRDVYKKQ